MKKMKNKSKIKEIFYTGITCYTSFFPEIKTKINLYEEKFYLYKSGSLYCSKNVKLSYA